MVSARTAGPRLSVAVALAVTVADTVINAVAVAMLA